MGQELTLHLLKSVIILRVSQNIRHPFASHKNFLDPQYNSDGTLYAPVRFKQITLERFYITKNSNISFSDTGKMTPEERKLVLKWIKEQFDAQQKALQEAKQKSHR